MFTIRDPALLQTSKLYSYKLKYPSNKKTVQPASSPHVVYPSEPSKNKHRTFYESTEFKMFKIMQVLVILCGMDQVSYLGQANDMGLEALAREKVRAKVVYRQVNSGLSTAASWFLTIKVQFLTHTFNCNLLTIGKHLPRLFPKCRRTHVSFRYIWSPN